ncbi:MAG: pyruvate formate-lyase-activating protein [Ruminococcus sp.]
MSESVKGRVHSIQSMGTLDGPGVRYVVFFQGCNLRCKCCHNPDTWDTIGGSECSAQEIVAKAVRYKEYFGNVGGITLSGGEPLLQPEFALEIFKLCRSEGINTCLDTSGSILSESTKALLYETDRVLLDIKYTSDELYKENVGCSIETPIKFLDYLNSMHIPTTVRQVIIPKLNDDVRSIASLKNLIAKYPCVDKVELLPFRKICMEKYQRLGIEFPFFEVSETTEQKINELYQVFYSL